MKKNIKTIILALLIMIIPVIVYSAQPAPAINKNLIQPPTIHIPYKGIVATEINISDNDILGLIKQLIPEAMGLITCIAQNQSLDLNAQDIEGLRAISKVDITPFCEAIAGVTNFRVMIVKYPANTDAKTLISQLDSGVAKTGSFSRIIGEYSPIPNAFSLFTESNGRGYITYKYDVNTNILYIGRIVGNLDLAKLSKWAESISTIANPSIKTQVEPIEQSNPQEKQQ